MIIKLARVPSADDLVIKATTSGITVLKQNRFRSRYTGNKQHAVDINGNLWESSADLRARIAYEREESAIWKAGGDRAVALWKAKKKVRVETQTGTKYPKMDNTNIQQPVESKDQLPVIIPPKPRVYSIHKREVRQRLLGFINTGRGKKELYFWTITFPMGTLDDIAYQIYNIWLTALRKYKMLRDYLWVAERQENKTIHFHMAIPHKMPVQKANAMMRGTLKTFARRGKLPFSVHQCARYNGVDIAKNRATRRVTNFAVKKGARALTTYLTKYITKNDGKFLHLAWHNSRGFSSIFTGVTFTVPEFTAHGFDKLINRAKGLSTEFFTFVPWVGDPPPLIMQHLYELNTFLQTLN